MPRSLFPAFSGGTASPAPWWPFGLVLHVAGVVVCVCGGGARGGGTDCWVGEGHARPCPSLPSFLVSGDKTPSAWGTQPS